MADGDREDRGPELCVRWVDTAEMRAHLFVWPWVGDGKGRSREVAREDEGWCAAVARFSR